MAKNKKILIVTECFYPEEFKINDVALSWKGKGYDVSVLTLVPTYPLGSVFSGYSNNKLYSKSKWNGICIYRLHATTGYKDSKFKKMLKYVNLMVLGGIVSLAIGRKYDYIFGFNAGALTSMLPAVWVHKLYRIPVTLWVQDIWPDSVYAYGFKKTKVLSFCLDSFAKYMYRNIDNIAISGKGFESKLKPYAKDNMVFSYAPNWADDLNMDLDPASFGGKNRVQLTFAGNLGKVQNLENIILAFNELDAKYEERVQLNIIGDGSALEELKVLGVKNNIVFHGKKPRNKMGKYYAASDFLIVSLTNEPIFEVTVPAKTQTYIAAKKPILAIISGDTANIVRDNNLGLVADPGDITSIKDIFIQAIEADKASLEQFTENCDSLRQNVFNQDVIINRLLKLTTANRKVSK